MTKKEAIGELKLFKGHTFTKTEEALDMAIEALKQESRKDEVILTKEEYGKLVSSEFDNGYAKGFREALDQEPSTDAVSRQAVIDIFGSKGEFDWVLNCAVEKIKELPPVTPTRVKAHWIKSESKEGYYKCSKCLCEHNDPETGKWHEIFDFKYPLCPICGADMREGEA